MSSIQSSLPLATNKVLTAIADLRKVSENEFDYYIEPVAIRLNDGYAQQYRVYINYFNGIQIIGDLSAWNSGGTRIEPVVGEMIGWTTFSHGKITFQGHPFYVDIPVETDTNTNADMFVTLKSHSGTTYYVAQSVSSFGSTGEGIIDRYTYNSVNKTITYDDNDQKDLPSKIYNSVFIQCSYTNEDDIIVNDVFYLASIPNKRTDTIVCYRYKHN